MTKEEVATAIGGLETWGRTVDNWVLICAIGVAIFLLAEAVFSVMHWRNENKLRPLRAAQERLHEEEMARLNRDFERSKNVNLVLQKSLESRRIQIFGASSDGKIGGDPKRNELYDVMRKFPGTLVLIQSVPDFEAQILAGDIAAVAKHAGWHAVLMTEEHSHIPSGYLVVPGGVKVITFEESPWSEEPPGDFKPVRPKLSALSEGAQALAQFLALDLNHASGFGANWSPEYSGRMRSFPQFNFPDRAVLVLVGPRPEPPPVELLMNTPAPADGAKP